MWLCEFLVGTQAMSRKEGILYAVGRSYVTLYEEASQNFVVCDIFSLKFVTFYLPGRRPGQTGGGGSIPMVNIPGVGSVPAGEYGLGTAGAAGNTAARNTTGSPHPGPGIVRAPHMCVRRPSAQKGPSTEPRWRDLFLCCFGVLGVLGVELLELDQVLVAGLGQLLVLLEELLSPLGEGPGQGGAIRISIRNS